MKLKTKLSRTDLNLLETILKYVDSIEWTPTLPRDKKYALSIYFDLAAYVRKRFNDSKSSGKKEVSFELKYHEMFSLVQLLDSFDPSLDDLTGANQLAYLTIRLDKLLNQ